MFILGLERLGKHTYFTFVVRRRSEPFAHIPQHLGVQLGVFSGSGASTAKDTPNGIN
jgi:hypothetical protein